MKVHETRSHAHHDEERMLTRKQKADSKQLQDEPENSPTKKPKTTNGAADEKKAEEEEDGKATGDVAAAEFDKFCRDTSEHLSVQQMRQILQDNDQDSSGPDDAIVPRW